MVTFSTKIVRPRTSAYTLAPRGSNLERTLQTSVRRSSTVLTKKPGSSATSYIMPTTTTSLTPSAAAALIPEPTTGLPGAPAQQAVAALPAQRLTAAMPQGGGLALGGIGGSISTAGSNIMNTVGSYIPLAIKIIVAVVVIKIVLALIKGRRR